MNSSGRTLAPILADVTAKGTRNSLLECRRQQNRNDTRLTLALAHYTEPCKSLI
jgi:hypothetical protein